MPFLPTSAEFVGREAKDRCFARPPLSSPMGARKAPFASHSIPHSALSSEVLVCAKRRVLATCLVKKSRDAELPRRSRSSVANRSRHRLRRTHQRTHQRNRRRMRQLTHQRNRRLTHQRNLQLMLRLMLRLMLQRNHRPMHQLMLQRSHQRMLRRMHLLTLQLMRQRMHRPNLRLMRRPQGLSRHRVRLRRRRQFVRADRAKILLLDIFFKTDANLELPPASVTASPPIARSLLQTVLHSIVASRIARSATHLRAHASRIATAVTSTDSRTKEVSLNATRHRLRACRRRRRLRSRQLRRQL